MEKVNIICLYWVGKFRGRDFTLEDVYRLYNSVKKHIDRDFDFYCLTNIEYLVDSICMQYPIYFIPLKYAWPGWWSKMELHRPDLPSGRTLYMDLDSHAIRSLQPILDYEGDLVMFDTRQFNARKWTSNSKLILRYQAATMLFDPGCEVMKNVWEKFIKKPHRWMREYRSDQDIMGDWIPDQSTFPKEWMCKLNTIRDYKEPPENVIIVTGQPRDNLFRRTESIKWFESMAR